MCDFIAMKTIVLTTAAAKQFDALPVTVQETIEEALALYAILGQGDVKRLQGRSGYRLRVGRYRVVFAEDGITVLVVYVGKRETTTYR